MFELLNDSETPKEADKITAKRNFYKDKKNTNGMHLGYTVDLFYILFI